MPVEVTRVKGELRKLFPKVNLTTKRIDEISARLAKKAADDADDAAIEQLINDANEYYPFAEIAKDDDRVRTLEANQKSKDTTDEIKGKGDQNPDPGNPKTKDDEDMPAWAKTMMKANETLLQEVTQLKQGKIIENKREEARKLFSQNSTFKGLSEKAQNHYLNQLKYDDEQPLDEQITGLEEVVKDIVQANADATELPGRPPAGKEPNALSEKDMDKIIQNARI